MYFIILQSIFYYRSGAKDFHPARRIAVPICGLSELHHLTSPLLLYKENISASIFRHPDLICVKGGGIDPIE